MQVTQLKIAFIGGGNMARALIGGLMAQGVAAANIGVGEPLASAREALQREFGVRTSADNGAAIADATTVVLAVKPQECAAVLSALKLPSTVEADSPRVLLSIAAGVLVADLQRLSPNMCVVRAMPNRAAFVGAGISGVYAGADVTQHERAQAELVLQAVGRVVWLPREADLDLVTALSGSGPAYFFLLAEQMAAAAARLGLDPVIADTLAAETLYGAGQLAHTGPGLTEQRQAVTSKGGTTEAALRSFAAAGFDAMVAAAVRAAAERSVELAARINANP